MSHFDEDWDDDEYCDDDYDDPPLYPPGRIEAMSDAELIAEANRQCNIHDSAVDRCVEMGSPVIENAAARLSICDAECDRRGIKWLDTGDEDSCESESEL